MTNTSLQVILPSGNRAVYEVQPQHLQVPGLGQNQSAIYHGRQIAVQIDGGWRWTKGRAFATPQEVAVLESTPMAHHDHGPFGNQ